MEGMRQQKAARHPKSRLLQQRGLHNWNIHIHIHIHVHVQASFGSSENTWNGVLTIFEYFDVTYIAASLNLGRAEAKAINSIKEGRVWGSGF